MSYVVTLAAKGSGKTWAVTFDSAAQMLDWTEAHPDLVNSWAPIVPLDEAIKYLDAEDVSGMRVAEGSRTGASTCPLVFRDASHCVVVRWSVDSDATIGVLAGSTSNTPWSCENCGSSSSSSLNTKNL